MNSRQQRLWTLVSIMALLLLSLGALPPALGADKIETVYITTPTIWEGVQTLSTDVVILGGGHLTIVGDCTVQASGLADPDPYAGGLSARIEIIVDDGGTLFVEPGALLTAPNPGDWYGIVFLPGSAGMVSGATIRNGTVGVTIHGVAPTIESNTIRDMEGFSPALPYGSPGGMAAGIVIRGPSSVQVVSNTISNILGGGGALGQDGDQGLPGGGSGGDGTAAGDGGAAYGIYITDGAEPMVQGNVISSITGGSGPVGGHGGDGTGGWALNPTGGNGGASGNGGRGGPAVGIYAEGAGNALIENNHIFALDGGNGGMSGNGGYAGPGWHCELLLQPEQAGSGGNGGSGGNAGFAGSGGDAIGIQIESCSPIVWDNTIGALLGGHAEAGGNGGPGSWGGDGCPGGTGQDGGAGGLGGNGGQGGAGGYGGNAIGIYVRGSSTADIRHNTVNAQLKGGPSEDGGAGGGGASGGHGGDGGEDSINPAGNGGDGGSGGRGGNGGEAGLAGTAIGIHVFGGTPTVARNHVTALLGGTSEGVGGPGGSGGQGGGGGSGGTGPFAGNGGHGGQGGDGGVGGVGGYGGWALGISAAAHRVENNLLYSFVGGNGAAAGSGGPGGNGGDGGDGGNANAWAGNGGDGGNGGNGSHGGSSGRSYGLALAGSAEVFNNTVNNMGINDQPGAGSSGGSGGSGGNPGSAGQPGTPGSSGSTGNPGVTGDEGSAYGIAIAADLPVIINNIVTVTGVGQAHGSAATSFGIFSAVGPLTLNLDYNNVWGWDTGSYYEVTPGAHDISVDPVFVDFNNGDYHLQAGSPCRDTGYSGANMPTDDLDGNSRPQGASHDMGAYEYVESSCIPVSGVTISGPTSGLVGVTYGFNATVAPADATTPIAYTWAPAPGGGQGSANASYTWLAAGTYNISVAVSNCGGAGTGSDDHSITIVAGPVYQVFLPLVAR